APPSETSIVGPTPNALLIRLANAAPMIPPTAVAPITTPSLNGLRPTSRTPYTMKMVMNPAWTKLNVPDRPSRDRRIGLPYTECRPSAIDLRIVGRTSGTSGAGSGLRIVIRPSAEHRYDTASAVSVIGAVRMPTSRPAMPGPATSDSDELACIRLLLAPRF